MAFPHPLAAELNGLETLLTVRLKEAGSLTPVFSIAVSLGEQAARDGRPFSDNPFPPKTTAWAWHRRGWRNQAQADTFRSEQPAGVPARVYGGFPSQGDHQSLPAAQSGMLEDRLLLTYEEQLPFGWSQEERGLA